MNVTVKAGHGRVRDYSGALIGIAAEEVEQRIYSGERLHTLIGYDVEMRLSDGSHLSIDSVQEEYIEISHAAKGGDAID